MRDSEFFEAYGDLYPRKPVAHYLQEAFGPQHAGSVQRFLSCYYFWDATLHGENTTLPDGSIQMGKHFKLERFWIYTLTDAPSVIDRRVSGEHWQTTDTALDGYPVYSAGRVRASGADKQNVYALSPDPGKILLATSIEMLKAMLAAHRGDGESILDMTVYADLKDVLEPGAQCVIQTIGAQQLLVTEQKVRSGEISKDVAE